MRVKQRLLLNLLLREEIMVLVHIEMVIIRQIIEVVLLLTIFEVVLKERRDRVPRTVLFLDDFPTAIALELFDVLASLTGQHELFHLQLLSAEFFAVLVL